MFSSSDIRREAREVLGGRFFGGEWLYAVLAVFLSSAVSSVIGSIPFAGIVLAGPIAIGLAGYFMNRVRRRTSYDSLGVIIDSAKEDLGGNIVVGILSTLYTLLWSLLFVIPGIVKGISYSMAYYIKRDNPNLTASEAITKSRELMNGLKMTSARGVAESVGAREFSSFPSPRSASVILSCSPRVMRYLPTAC